jgi:hypothetical protein
MVLNRGDGPSPSDLRVSLLSLAELGQSLRVARQLAGLTITEAASRVGAESTELEALESGNVGQMLNRIETLRTLRAYADSLGLAGDDYLVAIVALWPAAGDNPTKGGENRGRHVVSVSTAPVGGHSPAGARGGEWTRDRTGVADASISEVVGIVRAQSIHDTGRVPLVDTGQVTLPRQSTPALLKVMVAFVALLVALGGVALAEHSHVGGWYHKTEATTSHWFDNTKVALGLSPSLVHRAPHKVAQPLPKVTMVESPATDSVVINVGAPTFTVKMVAFKYPSWIEATNGAHRPPVFAQVLPGGQIHTFTVTTSLSIETASSSGRAYLYEGSRFIGYYFPTRVPFTMTFNTTK